MQILMSILSIVALNLILYTRTMKFLLVADDLSWYVKYKDGWKGWPIWQRLYGGFTFGKNVSLDHLFTTALHTLIAVLIYVAFGLDLISFCAAILYSCNPINNQTSIWLNGRRYAINIILVLGMIIVSKIPLGFIPASILYAITSLFQVTAIFSPILLIPKYPWMALAIALFLALGYKQIKRKITKRYRMVHDDDRIKFTPKRLIIITKVYGHYFFKMFFPGICAMTYPKLHFWGQTKEGNKDAYSFNWDFIIGVISICLSALGIYALNEETRFMWIFMCVSLLQWCAIIPIVQDLADRYANVPNVFAMFFLSYFVHTYAGQYALPILAVFVGYYIPNLLTVMRMYKSEGDRWSYQRYFFPQLSAPLKFEAEYLIHDQKNPMKAWVLIQEYLKYGGCDFTILFQAAKCHQMVGRLDEARNFAKLASENYHVGHEEIESNMIKVFLERCVMPTYAPPIGNTVQPSRQVRRAEERKKNK